MMGGERPTLARRASKQAEPDANGVARERVVDIQRSRMLAAMVEVCGERDTANTTVAHVVQRSGVSRRTFYEVFRDREECFLVAFDEGIARASRCVLDAYDPNARWAERVRSSLAALLTFLDTEPGIGKLLVVGSLGAGANTLERRRRVLAGLVAFMCKGPSQGNAGREPPPLTAEGIVGGALAVIHARIVEGTERPLIELLNPLMAMIVLPYLGTAAARRELERPVSRVPRRSGAVDHDPLRELGMRLTYRTVRVLLSIAIEPGCSNRDVGVAAGIADQGQISKLLSRLQRLGLVQNDGPAPAKGVPNAWSLTAKGVEVERAMSADARSNGRARWADTTGRGRG